MGKRKDLPVIIGKNLRKGLVAFKDGTLQKGFNLCVVWLKNDGKSGEEFEITDIDKIDTELHFCDRESVDRMIEILQWISEMFERESTEPNLVKDSPSLVEDLVKAEQTEPRNEMCKGCTATGDYCAFDPMIDCPWK